MQFDVVMNALDNRGKLYNSALFIINSEKISLLVFAVFSRTVYGHSSFYFKVTSLMRDLTILLIPCHGWSNKVM